MISVYRIWIRRRMSFRNKSMFLLILAGKTLHDQARADGLEYVKQETMEYLV